MKMKKYWWYTIIIVFTYYVRVFLSLCPLKLKDDFIITFFLQNKSKMSVKDNFFIKVFTN